MDKTIVILFSLLNYWIFKISQDSILLSLILICLSLLLYLSIKTTRYFWAVLVLVLISYLPVGFSNPLEPSSRVDTRHLYFSQQWQGFYQKPAIIYYSKIYPALYSLQKGFFEAIDPNLYFFNNHPRERGGDFDKYPSIFLPFFIVGFIATIMKKVWAIGAYFLVAFLITVVSQISVGPILFFPLINVFLTIGLLTTLKLRWV